MYKGWNLNFATKLCKLNILVPIRLFLFWGVNANWFHLPTYSIELRTILP